MENSTNPLEKVVIQGNEEDKESPDRSWIGGLVAGVLVLILTAVFGFLAWKRGRKMAELLHKEALAEEALRRADADAKLATHAEERADIMIDVAHAQEALDALKLERIEHEQKYQESRDRLDGIVSWDDVDSYIGSPAIGEVPVPSDNPD